LIPLTAEEVAGALGISRFPEAVTGVSTDTRSLVPGDLFVALRGERSDGHLHVAEALARGAVAALVESAWAKARGGLLREEAGAPSSEQAEALGRVVPVPDTFRALGALGLAVRRRSGCRVIAVTGSVGKTGTKDLIAGMVSRELQVLATRANENNEVGVPQTLLRIDTSTECVVVEMGMRGPGQIAELAAIAEPDVGVITNVAPVHLELLGSVYAIGQAKVELIQGLPEHGVGVAPAGNPLLDELLANEDRRRIVRFAVGASATGTDIVGRVVPGEGVEQILEIRWPEGQASVVFPFSGAHRIENAVCAAAACYAAGLSLERCLPGVQSVALTGGRGDEHLVGGIRLVDDSYNANPVAVAGALADLVTSSRSKGGRTVAVLGDMLELGPQAAEYHYQIGGLAARLGIAVLFGVGSLSEYTVNGFADQSGEPGRKAGSPDEAQVGEVFAKALQTALAVAGDTGAAAGAQGESRLFDASGECVEALAQALREGDHVLVKGSRGMRLEEVVQSLLARLKAERQGLLS